ncbi:hypothetical protein ckin60_12060 [Helicobacter pylori]
MRNLNLSHFGSNVRSELIERIKNALDANRIEIPFNKLDISINKQDSSK